VRRRPGRYGEGAAASAGGRRPLLVRVEDGSPVPVEQVPLHLRRARVTRTGIDVNGEYCRSLLATRYALPGGVKQRSLQPVGGGIT
jgi:hypothetical protein